jgi:acyl-coenzyme A thioesterase 13
MRVERVEGGSVTCTLKVEKHLTNAYGTLHGAAISTLVDVVGTMAILSVAPTRAGVSVEINTSYMNAAKLGEEVRVHGKLLKLGRRLAVTEVECVRVRDGVLLASGRHTKAV